MKYFLIDFAESDKITALSALEVFEYDQDALESDMRLESVTDALQLTDYDRVVFDSESKADAFLSEYRRIYNSLNNEKICKDRSLPAMLYKRRFIVQSLMGFKNQTYRTYKKDWNVGQLFNLHDQTYFLTVQLTNLKYCEKKGAYKYEFVLA